MKERLGFGDWLAVAAHGAAGTLIAALGRVLQVAGVGVLLAGLWPTLAALVSWLKTGAWTMATPMSLAPELSRRVVGATEWVVVREGLSWLAMHHVLWTLLPAAILVFLAGSGTVAHGRAEAGRAADVLSQSLRDEYRLREGWGRWRPRLVALAAVALLATAGTALYLLLFRA